MIIGVIPIGGKGTRLGLPFSKELLPLAGFNYYKPVVENTTDNMIAAGANIIVFIHGAKHKLDILQHFNGPQFIHITQPEQSFAGVLKRLDDFMKETALKPTRFLFGLPDTYYSDNPFIKLSMENIFTCAIFIASKDMKVDRLLVGVEPFDKAAPKFDIKNIKTEENSNYFWGCFAFSPEDLRHIIENTDFNTEKEIGNIINNMPKIKCVQFGEYHDLGTWSSLNKYWKKL